MQRETLWKVVYIWTAALCLLTYVNHQQAVKEVQEAKRTYYQRELYLRQALTLRERAEGAAEEAERALASLAAEVQQKREELAGAVEELSNLRARQRAAGDKGDSDERSQEEGAGDGDQRIRVAVEEIRGALAPAKAFADECAASLAGIAAKQKRIDAQWGAYFRQDGTPLYPDSSAEPAVEEPEAWRDLAALHERYNERAADADGQSPHVPPEPLARVYQRAKELNKELGGAGVILDATRFLQTHHRGRR